MTGVGEQREAVGEQAADQLDDRERGGQRQRDGERAPAPLATMDVEGHRLTVPGSPSVDGL